MHIIVQNLSLFFLDWNGKRRQPDRREDALATPAIEGGQGQATKNLSAVM